MQCSGRWCRNRMQVCFTLIVFLLLSSVSWGQITGEIISVGIEGESGGRGMYRLGHWVPVRVRLENRTGQRFAGFLAVEQSDLDGDRVRSIGSHFILEPSLDPRELWFYYWPRPDGGKENSIREVVVLDESKSEVAKIKMRGEATAAAALGPVNPYDEQSQRWLVILGPNSLGMGSYVGAKGGATTMRLAWVQQAGQLPDNVLGFDGVDVLVWQADHVRVSEMSPDFQLKAILDWVKAGGHLIITVGSRWQEVGDPNNPLADALPILFKNARTLDNAAILKEFTGQVYEYDKDRKSTSLRGKFVGGGEWGKVIPGPYIQALGDIKRNDAGRVFRVVPNEDGKVSTSPLVVTGTYGAGAVTVVTIDMASANFNSWMTAAQWLAFWQQVGGWRGTDGGRGEIWPKAVYDEVTHVQKNQQDPDDLLSNPGTVTLDTGIDGSVDLSKQTALRFLLAVLFLGFYWLAAGPAGHFILRRYNVPHWSWWIFGATVLGASAIAVVIVSGMRIASSELRHRTYVMGSANNGQASVVSYYGLFTPVEGKVKVDLGEPAKGLGYIAPLNNPKDEPPVSYADPQHYDLVNTEPTSVLVPFRNTLKKMQARWFGPVPGIESANIRIHLEPVPESFTIKSTKKIATGGSAGVGGERLALEGTLVNKTGYDLKDVSIVALAEGQRGKIILNELHTIFDLKNGDWKNGQTLDLHTVQPRLGSLDENLLRVGRNQENNSFGNAHHMIDEERSKDNELAQLEKHPADLLTVLLDTRPSGSLLRLEGGRTTFIRQMTRLVDRSKSLRASRLLVIAHAGGPSDGVAAPLPLKVDDKIVKGSGEILFTWTVELQ